MLLVCIVAGALLSACGGGGAPKAAGKRSSLPGGTFRVPAAWQVTRTASSTTAKGDGGFIQVTRFALLKAYDVSLFDKVDAELRARLVVAAGKGAKVVDAGDATVAGVRSHTFRVERTGGTDDYTYVLVGRREFQLVCRPAGSPACGDLRATFTLSS